MSGVGLARDRQVARRRRGHRRRGERRRRGMGRAGGSVSFTGERVRRDQVELVLERIVTPLGLRVDRSQPIVDARLADGCRVHAVVPPASVDGPCLAIRRFAARPVPLDSFCSPEVAATLSSAVADGRSILVSGGTGSGKTTLLNCLAGYLPTSARVVTVEDAAELVSPILTWFVSRAVLRIPKGSVG